MPMIESGALRRGAGRTHLERRTNKKSAAGAATGLTVGSWRVEGRSAIREYVDGFTKRSGIRLELELSTRVGRMAADVELALFRVVQEALTNIQRHSGSQRAKIRIDCDSDLTLEISDRGRGESIRRQ